MNTQTAIWSNDWDQVVPLDAPEPKHAWSLKVRPVLEDLLFWENLDLIEDAESDPAVNPGQLISNASMERERTRRTLRTMIRRFVIDGLTLPTGEPVRVSPITAKAAERILALLPDDIALPKMAPDEDGGLVFAWEKGGRTDLLIVDGWRLHFVENAGTQQTQYHDDLEFAGDALPEVVDQALRS